MKAKKQNNSKAENRPENNEYGIWIICPKTEQWVFAPYWRETKRAEATH